MGGSIHGGFGGRQGGGWPHPAVGRIDLAELLLELSDWD